MGAGGKRGTLPPRGVSRIGTASAQKKGGRPGDPPQPPEAEAPADTGKVRKGGKKQAAALSAEAVAGKAPLSSFSQLAALLARRDEAPPPAPQEAPPAQPVEGEPPPG